MDSASEMFLILALAKGQTNTIHDQQEEIQHLEQTVDQLKTYIEQMWNEHGFFPTTTPIPDCLENVHTHDQEGRSKRSHLWVPKGKSLRVKKRKKK